jgi:glutamyl-tRNA reductase
MRLHVTGLNHRTAPVEVREKVAFDEASLPAALKMLRAHDGMLEGLILSTCNRVEIVVAADESANLELAVDQVLGRPLHQHLYRFEGREAIQHLFRVAASLDSMIVGEPQILGQLKQAYSVAKAEGAVNGFLDTVLTRAFNVAKRVRTETEIGESAVSVSFAAVELAKEIFGSLDGRKVMLVGAGKMSELAARHLRRSGVSKILVSNRTEARAKEMAQVFDGTIVPYERFAESLPEVDIVITSSAAPHYILTLERMRAVIAKRRNRPIFLIDIAVPRNIEPEINTLENVFLYDIDDLQRTVETNLKGRLQEAEQAEIIIAEEVEKLMARLQAREIAPAVIALQERFEQIRASEVQRLRGKLGPLTPAQQEAIDALTRGIVNKIAHGPLAEMRAQAARPDVIEVIRRMFRVGDSE